MRHKSSMSAKNNSSSLESSHGGSRLRSLASHTERSKEAGKLCGSSGEQSRAGPGSQSPSVGLFLSQAPLFLRGSVRHGQHGGHLQTLASNPSAHSWRPGPLGYTTAIPTQWGARARSRSLRAGVGERAMERPSEGARKVQMKRLKATCLLGAVRGTVSCSRTIQPDAKKMGTLGNHYHGRHKWATVTTT